MWNRFRLNISWPARFSVQKLSNTTVLRFPNQNDSENITAHIRGFYISRHQCLSCLILKKCDFCINKVKQTNFNFVLICVWGAPWNFKRIARLANYCWQHQETDILLKMTQHLHLCPFIRKYQFNEKFYLNVYFYGYWKDTAFI